MNTVDELRAKHLNLFLRIRDNRRNMGLNDNAPVNPSAYVETPDEVEFAAISYELAEAEEMLLGSKNDMAVIKKAGRSFLQRLTRLHNNEPRRRLRSASRRRLSNSRERY